MRTLIGSLVTSIALLVSATDPWAAELDFTSSKSPSATYNGWIAPVADPSVLQEHSLGFQIPAYSSELDSISLFGTGDVLHVPESPPLSPSGTAIPTHLWKAELGGQSSRKVESQKIIGTRIAIGSASDRPFTGLRVTTVSVGGYYSFPSSERSRWILTLFVSNNNPILNYVPIPGFIYLYTTRELVGMFGFPFTSVRWFPLEKLALSAAILGPTVAAETAYGKRNGVQGFGAFSWAQKPYLRRDRSENEFRLYFVEKRAFVGIRAPLPAGVFGEGQVGYAFDRSFYEGKRVGQKQGGSVDLAHSWFASWSMKVEL